jgi:hypothetical protein
MKVIKLFLPLVDDYYFYRSHLYRAFKNIRLVQSQWNYCCLAVQYDSRRWEYKRPCILLYLCLSLNSYTIECHNSSLSDFRLIPTILRSLEIFLQSPNTLSGLRVVRSNTCWNVVKPGRLLSKDEANGPPQVLPPKVLSSSQYINHHDYISVHDRCIILCSKGTSISTNWVMYKR